MEFLYPNFYACVRLRFLDVETNHDPRRPVPTVCRLCSDVWGLAGNLIDLTVTSSRYDILFCSETLVSDYASRIRVAGSRIWSVCLVGAGARCLGPEEWRHTYEMDMERFANPNLSVVVAKCWFLGFVVRDKIFSVY